MAKGKVVQVFGGRIHTGMKFPKLRVGEGVMFESGQWYWRARAANGRIVSVSGEGYNSKATCVRMAKKYAPVFPLEVEK